MTVSTTEARSRAQAFANEWSGVTDERQESQSFWEHFFRIFDLERRHFARFEKRVQYPDGGNGFIDVFWPGKLLCEQKSAGRNLEAAYKQALGYLDTLPSSDVPRYVIVSDFARMKVYDHDTDELREFTLEELPDNIELFDFIRRDQDAHAWDQEQTEASVKACEELSGLHDLIKEAGYTGHKLEVFLVRLLFCFFAEDSGVFDNHQFSRYVLEHSEDNGADMGPAINMIFEVLNTPEQQRMSTLPPEVQALPYVNGGVFSEYIPSVGFDRNMRLAFWKCSQLDWKNISPSIFGSIFQGVMDGEARRAEGAHYTSEHNIRKVIDALFLNDLYAEFVAVRNDRYKLKRFHAKLAGLTFFDPACGSGNFLTTAYKELRHLEDQVLEILSNGQTIMDLSAIVKVNVGQFYGIELLDFPCQIANVAIWLADHQANRRTGQVFGLFYRHLPLHDYHQIVGANALRMEWADLIKPDQCSYIFGNPPFIGAMHVTETQRDELRALFDDARGCGEIDYVAGWYLKAAKFITGTSIRCAFVSTNSICQGLQVGVLWRELVETYDVSIDFAYHKFPWENDARGLAHVHVIIVGFGIGDNERPKRLYTFIPASKETQTQTVTHINGYLAPAADVYVVERSAPLSDVPPMRWGSQPRTKGLVLSSDDKAGLVAENPLCSKWIRPFWGADEFLKRKERYCLWLVGADPSEIIQCPGVVARINQVREERLASRAAATRALAATPTLFAQIAHPDTDYILVPRHSSERRDYVPIGFVSSEVIASDATVIVPEATLYHFGVLTSQIHNAWMRTVAGRIKSDYRYAKDLVYNTFVWPEASPEQVSKIEVAARAVLDARTSYPRTRLGDLYRRDLIPPELLRAHRALDREVERAYGIRFDGNEEMMVAHLFQLYAGAAR